MKKLFAVFISVCIVLMYSCNENSEENTCPPDCRNCNILSQWVSDSIWSIYSSTNYNLSPPSSSYSSGTYPYNDTFNFFVEDTAICNYIFDVAHHTHSGYENSYTWYLKTWQNDTIQFGYSEFSNTGYIVLYPDENKMFVNIVREYGSAGIMYREDDSYYLRRLQ